MPGLPNCTGREAVRAFERLGYRTVRQNGSHVRMKCPGRISLTVPVHHSKDLAPGTLRGLISKSGISVEEFVAALSVALPVPSLERRLDTEFVHLLYEHADVVAEHLAERLVYLPNVAPSSTLAIRERKG